MSNFQKIASKASPDSDAVSRLQNEHFITQGVDAGVVLKSRSLRQQGGRYVLDFEEFDGSPLSEVLSARRLSLTKSLALAIKITQALSVVHDADILHLNLSPASILVNLDTEEVRITGFGLARKGQLGKWETSSSALSDQDWRYTAPEQTGRINRKADFRADLYSIGLVFYEMLSGTHPFSELSDMQLIHAHLTRKPASLHESPNDAGHEVPVMVGKVVDLLLAKNAESRYQTTFGLLRDLRHITDQLDKTGEITEFDLGKYDLTGKLQVSQKIYGRDGETEQLLQAFEDCINGITRPVLVAGKSGVGKTALVGQLKERTSLANGIFIDCKFHQFKRDTPFFAILNAFEDLIDLILAQKDVSLSEWRGVFEPIVGSYGKIVIEHLPRMQLILGPPQEVELDIRDVQNLFNSLLLKMLRAISERLHPLVLHIDDLQWADMASLRWILSLFNRFKDNAILPVCSYRNNELNPGHPFLVRLHELREAGLEVLQIELRELSESDVVHFLEDTFQQYESPAIDELAKLFYKKTDGNAFYLKSFLNSLYEKDLFTFDVEERNWRWKIREIELAPATDNVIELISSDLVRQPADLLEVLSLAACLGHTFSARELVGLSSLPMKESMQLLISGVEKGFLAPAGDSSLIDLMWAEGDQMPEAHFKFIHDSIYYAVYSRIDEERRMDTHWRIGNHLLESLNEAEQHESLYKICNHLNKAIPRIKDDAFGLDLAKRNLEACIQAKAASAFDTSKGFVDHAMELFKRSNGDENSRFYWDILRESSEVAYFILDGDELKKMSRLAIAKAPSPMHQASIYEIRIIDHIQNSRLELALGESFEILNKLGVHLPSDPDKKSIILALVKTRLKLRGRTADDLRKLQPVDNEGIVWALRLMKQLAHAAFFSAPAILAVTVLKMIRLILRYGQSEIAAAGYIGYSIILNGVLNDQKTGTDFGKLGLELSNQTPEGHQRNFVGYIYYGFIHFWQAPLSDCLAPLRNNYEDMMEKGDWENTSFASLIYLSHMFHNGDGIPRIQEMAFKLQPQITPIRKASGLYAILMQALHNLSSDEDLSVDFHGPYFDQRTGYDELVMDNDGNALGYYALYKSLIYLLAGEFESIEADERVAFKIMEYRKSSIHFPLYLSIRSHALYKLYRQGKRTRRDCVRFIRKYIKRLEKYAHQGPDNFEDIYRLVLGDYYAVQDDFVNAQKAYQRAIEAAKQFGHPMLEGIASEAFADMFSAVDNSVLAAFYCRNAQAAYLNWGAAAKARQVENTYQALRTRETTGVLGQLLEESSGGQRSTTLDETTVWQAARAISGEVHLDELIATILDLAVENAGANHGIFLMETDGRWLVKATTKEKGTILNAPLEGFEGIPVNIAKYVLRTRESVILNDPQKSDLFSSESYIQRERPLSVLCTPVTYKGKIQAVLYLENNMIKGAFTEERIELLYVLLTQMSISIENAKLYENLDEAYRSQLQLTEAYSKFVPHEFIRALGYETILDVQKGKQVAKDITIFFSDIRSYTTLSEEMTPSETFDFIQKYLNHMVPIIRSHNGFVSQYLGDGIMAMFMDDSVNAIDAAIAIQKRHQHLDWRSQLGVDNSVRTGIGIHFGSLMMGIIGTENRLDTGFIADSVNTAARLEGLTKVFGSKVLVSQNALDNLPNRDEYNYRFLGKAKIKGRKEIISIYDFYDGDPPGDMIAKSSTKDDFESGVRYFMDKDYSKAIEYLDKVMLEYPGDLAAARLLRQSHHKYSKEQQ